MGPFESFFSFDNIVSEPTSLVLAPLVLLGGPQFQTVISLFAFVIVDAGSLCLFLLLKDLLNERFATDLNFCHAKPSHTHRFFKDGFGYVWHVMFGHSTFKLRLCISSEHISD